MKTIKMRKSGNIQVVDCECHKVAFEPIVCLKLACGHCGDVDYRKQQVKCSYNVDKELVVV